MASAPNRDGGGDRNSAVQQATCRTVMRLRSKTLPSAFPERDLFTDGPIELCHGRSRRANSNHIPDGIEALP